MQSNDDRPESLPSPTRFIVCLFQRSEGPCSDVLERLYTAGGGGYPPPGPPPLPFQYLRLTAKILLRRLRCQEDLRVKIFGPPSAGTIGPWEEGGSQPTPPPPPLRPF